MARSLNISIGDNIVKYAIVSYNNNESLKVESYGIKFKVSEFSQLLDDIIKETSSENLPIIISPDNQICYKVQIYDRLKDKSYIQSMINLEFESWCEKNAKSVEKFSYSYLVSDTQNKDNRKNAFLTILPRDKIVEYLNTSKNIAGIYYAKPLIKKLVPANQKDYILISIDTTLTITVVMDKKIVEIFEYNIGMEQLLKEFANVLGSYQKSYEMCKNINVYTEEKNINDPSLEQIVEPIFQEILKECLPIVNKYKSSMPKVFLTGLGTMFKNVDLLFSQYLDIKSQILNPFYIEDSSITKEVLAANEISDVVSLGYEFLNPEYSELKYNIKKSKKIGKINKKVSKIGKDELNDGKIVNYLTYSVIVIAAFFVTYVLFSTIYSLSINVTIKKINEKKQRIIAQTQEVNSDIQYIDKNMNEYKSINDQIDDIKNKLENNQIGKFSTYNVAALLQNIMKIIPKNVQLINISSNDNKYVTITASADNYEDLGYFFAQIKLEGVLNNAKITKVNNGEITVIEIGGDLP